MASQSTTIRHAVCKRFQSMLRKYRARPAAASDTAPPACSHTWIVKNGPYGGRYYVPDDELPAFYETYRDAIDAGYLGHLVETHERLNGTPVLFDFDFERDDDGSSSVSECIPAFCDALACCIRRNVLCPDNFTILITQKACATVKKNGSFKFGFHAQVPDVAVSFATMHVIRLELMDAVPTIFADVAYKNAITDVVDYTVIRNNGFVMYGCRKPDGEFYHLRFVYDVKLDDCNLTALEFPSGSPLQAARERAELMKQYNFSLRLYGSLCDPTEACIGKIASLPADMLMIRKLERPPWLTSDTAPPQTDPTDDVECAHVDMRDVIFNRAATGVPRTTSLAKPLSPVMTAEYVMALPVDWSDHYDTWRVVCCEVSSGVVYHIIKGADDDYVRDAFTQYRDVFFKFSKRSAKFDADENAEEFQRAVDKGVERASAARPMLTTRSLRKHVRDLAYGVYLALRRKEIAENHLDFMYDLKQHIAPGVDATYKQYTSVRCMPFEFEPEYATCIMEVSPMGSGKTFQVDKFLKGTAPASAISIVPRVALGIDQHESWRLADGQPFHMYLDCTADAIQGAKHLICSVESLHKTQGNQFDVVILDEASSTMRQFKSPTVADRIRTWKRFVEIIKNAKQIIVTDATLDGPTVYHLTRLLRTHRFVIRKNTHQLYPRVFQILCDGEMKRRGREILIAAINHYLVNGKVVVNPSNAKNFLAEWESVALADADVRRVIEGRYRAYTAISSDVELKQDIANIRQVWGVMRYVGFSPVIDCGVNFAEPGIFDKCFLYACNVSTKGASVLQSAFRVREVTDPRVTVYIENVFTNNNDAMSMRRVAEKYEERRSQFREDYDKFVNTKLAVDANLRHVILDIRKLRAECADDPHAFYVKVNRLMDEKFDLPVQPDDTPRDEEADLLFNLHVMYEVDDNVWKHYYKECFEGLVGRLGHTVENVDADEYGESIGLYRQEPAEEQPKQPHEEDTPAEDTHEEVTRDDLNVTRQTTLPDYEEIALISRDEYVANFSLRNRKDATKQMKAEMEKYEYVKRFDALASGMGIDTTEAMRAAVFNAKKSNKRYAGCFDNLRLEFMATDAVIGDVLTQCRRAEIAHNHLQRQTVIRDICVALGVRNTMDVDSVIPVGVFKNVTAWSTLMKRAFDVLDRRDQSRGTGVSLKLIIKRLNGVLRDWSNVTLRVSEKESHSKAIISYKLARHEFSELFQAE